MPYKDKNDQRAKESRRRWYENNKQVVIDKTRQTQREMQEYIRELKSEPCMDCNQSYPYYVMDFDHRENKVGLIKEVMRRGSWSALLIEIAKCDIVCSNCHRERTWLRASSVVE